MALSLQKLKDIIGDGGLDALLASASGLDRRGYDVKTMGAVGDGVADDSAIIQDAVDNEIMYLPKGTYKFGSAVTVTKNLCIIADPGAVIYGNISNLFLWDYEADIDYFVCRDVTFKADSSATDTIAINFPNGKIGRVYVDNCYFDNTRFEDRIGDGSTPITYHKSTVTNNYFLTDGLGYANVRFRFRNGDYEIIPEGGTPPVEPRTDRRPGIYFAGNTFDVYPQNSENIDIAKFEGLSEYCTVIGNKFFNRNPLAAAELDFHPGGDALIYSNNQHYNCYPVVKNTGPYATRGYTETNVLEDKIISDNIMRFSKDSVCVCAMLVPGSFFSIVGNIIRARRADASIPFHGIALQRTDAAYAPENTTDVQFSVISSNIVDVRLDANTGGNPVAVMRGDNLGCRSKCVVSNNVFIGGNESGVTEETKPEVISGNYWAHTDMYASGDFLFELKIATGNIILKSDGTYMTGFGVGERSRPNQSELSYRAETSAVPNADRGSYFGFDTVALGAFSVTGLQGGRVGDIVRIIRAAATNALTLVHSSSFRLPGAVNYVLNSSVHFVEMIKMAPTVWVFHAGFNG